MKIKAGFLQFKPLFCEPKKNAIRIKEILQDKNFDLVILPELSNSGYYFTSQEQVRNSSEQAGEGVFTKTLLEISSNNKCFIVSGFNEFDGKYYYNSAILTKPDGSFVIYRKIHLYKEEKLWFTPGNLGFKVHKLVTGSGVEFTAGMTICFDWIFPESIRTLAMGGAQIICHPSNLVMPYCQKAMYARAVENKVFTITANRIGSEKNNGGVLKFTGQSVIYDPEGNLLAEGSKSKPELKFVSISPDAANDKYLNKYNHIFKDRLTKNYFKL